MPPPVSAPEIIAPISATQTVHAQSRTLKILVERGFKIRILRMTDLGDVAAFDTPGGEPALALWQRLRAAMPKSGYWPVILGPADDRPEFELVAEQSVAETIRAASRLAAPDCLGTPVATEPGRWPATVATAATFATAFDQLNGRAHEKVTIALVPSAEPWRAPAYLSFGGSNDCPGSDVHVAAMSYWFYRYGAEVVAATRDTIELRVTRPPETRSQAIELAGEHARYCPACLDDHAESLSSLAASLMQSCVWRFRWD